MAIRRAFMWWEEQKRVQYTSAPSPSLLIESKGEAVGINAKHGDLYELPQESHTYSETEEVDELTLSPDEDVSCKLAADPPILQGTVDVAEESSSVPVQRCETASAEAAVTPEDEILNKNGTFYKVFA